MMSGPQFTQLQSTGLSGLEAVLVLESLQQKVQQKPPPVPEF